MGLGRVEHGPYGGNLGPAFNWDSGYPGVSTFTTPDPSQANRKSGALYWSPDSGRLGYTQSWNFNIQRELPFKMVLDAGYIGTKGTALMANGLGLLNQLSPNALVLGSLLTSNVTSQAALPAAAVAMGARYPFGATGQSVPIWQTLLPFPQLLTGSHRRRLELTAGLLELPCSAGAIEQTILERDQLAGQLHLVEVAGERDQCLRRRHRRSDDRVQPGPSESDCFLRPDPRGQDRAAVRTAGWQGKTRSART